MVCLPSVFKGNTTRTRSCSSTLWSNWRKNNWISSCQCWERRSPMCQVHTHLLNTHIELHGAGSRCSVGCSCHSGLSVQVCVHLCFSVCVSPLGEFQCFNNDVMVCWWVCVLAGRAHSELLDHKVLVQNKQPAVNQPRANHIRSWVISLTALSIDHFHLLETLLV